MARSDDERELEAVVAPRLRGWLQRARDVIMRPFTQWGGLPDASGAYREQQAWDSDVDTILATISRISMGAWSEATDVPPVSRHAFIMAHLATVQNLLVRVPDEVANGVFAEVTDALNAGRDTAGVTEAVERYLSWTATERWPGRARTIAQTEANRARAAGTLAAGTEQARLTGRVLVKQWRTHLDGKERVEHHAADNQERPFWAPFQVGGENLMYPGDPTGSPWNVINCRCDMAIRNEGR